MPRNDTKYRVLTEEFREHLTRYGAWPDGLCYHSHMKQRGGQSKNTLTTLRAGWAEAEKASLGLVTMLLFSEDAPQGAQVAVLEFLEQQGVDDPAALTEHEIFEKVTGEPLTVRTPPLDARDYLYEGVRAWPEILSRSKRWISDQSRPSTQDEITDVVRWVQVFIAYTLASKSERESISAGRARPIAERHMGVSTDEYIQRAKAWMEWHSLIIRIALGPRYPAGCTVVLPLNPEAYQEVRSGKRASYECGPTDFCFPSQHLLIEIAAERVASERAEACNATKPLMAALHLQLAHLSAMHLQNPGTRIHLLSFAGTNVSKKRLAKQGFKPTGAMMPRSGLMILERTFSMGAMRGLEAATVGYFRWLAWLIPVS